MTDFWDEHIKVIPVELPVKKHDVSAEARDDHGRWAEVPTDAKSMRRHLIDDHGFHHTAVSHQMKGLTRIHDTNHGLNGEENVIWRRTDSETGRRIPLDHHHDATVKKTVEPEAEVEPLNPYDGPGDNEDVEDSDDLDWVTDFRREHKLRVDEESH